MQTTEELRELFNNKLPWTLQSRLTLKVHNDLVERCGPLWTVEDTSKIIGIQYMYTRQSIRLAKALEKFPDLAKIGRRSAAYHLISKYELKPETLKLQLCKIIQKKETNYGKFQQSSSLPI